MLACESWLPSGTVQAQWLRELMENTHTRKPALTPEQYTQQGTLVKFPQPQDQQAAQVTALSPGIWEQAEAQEKWIPS